MTIHLDRTSVVVRDTHLSMPVVPMQTGTPNDGPI
jgi:hypothetical protein